MDFPDPTNFSLGKLYTTAFYRLLRHHVAQNGVVVVQSTSPMFARFDAVSEGRLCSAMLGALERREENRAQRDRALRFPAVS